jgi:hypothetical protein
MGRRQDTQPTASGYGQPSRGGLSVGAIQAASPLGFWWLDPATFTILKYRFSSRRRRSSCSCGPSSASVISPDLEHGERLILGARTGCDRSHEPATLRELMDRMGHSSTRAAMIHIHGNDARQHEIADTLSQLARQELVLRSSLGSYLGCGSVGRLSGGESRAEVLKGACAARWQ